MINEAQFRADLPEFVDTAKWLPSQIKYFLGLARLLLNETAWGPSAIDPWPSTLTDAPPLLEFDYGSEMFVAHNMALEALAQRAGAKGLIPGLMTGIAQSRGADKLSVSYDTKAGIVADAGHWNLTTYGVRFIQLARLMGMRAIQVGIGCEGGASPSFLTGGSPPWL